MDERKYFMGVLLALVFALLITNLSSILFPERVEEVPLNSVLRKASLPSSSIPSDGVMILVMGERGGIFDLTGGIIFPGERVILVINYPLEIRRIIKHTSFLNRTHLLTVYVIEAYILSGMQSADSVQVYEVACLEPFNVLSLVVYDERRIVYKELFLVLPRNTTIEIFGRALDRNGNPLSNSPIEVYWSTNATQVSMSEEALIQRLHTNSEGFLLIRICNITQTPFSNVLPVDASYIYIYSPALNRGIAVNRSKIFWDIVIRG